ncbi:molybdate ABC transporter substrate-binding protein [Arsenicicoccus piscis]|uniref:molybdate ABC transporter substrate-binding protein n=1 Tax=Arsenicicoccus piscis TaxID=673954 RepID=UPI001F4C6D36|nr:molybdate ABC transporter substrate-binding protein [Arsenicicoccus piscis]
MRRSPALSRSPGLDRSPGRAVTTAAIVLAGLGLAACGSGTTDRPAATSGGAASAGAGASAAAGPVSGEITVLAAASLKESFTTLAQQFEAAHPGVTVTTSFGASSTLAQQLVSGAPADVFAAASASTMQRAVQADRVDTPQTFAVNELTVVVPAANPGHVTALADLARPDVTVALCQQAVPCGAVAAAVLDRAGLQVTPVTREADVKAVLTKVRLGEVDAGMVYVTDAKASGATVRAIPVGTGAVAQAAGTSYPIATVKDSANHATAQAFADLVRSPQGRAVLTDAGFTAP